MFDSSFLSLNSSSLLLCRLTETRSYSLHCSDVCSYRQLAWQAKPLPHDAPLDKSLSNADMVTCGSCLLPVQIEHGAAQSMPVALATLLHILYIY